MPNLVFFQSSAKVRIRVNLNFPKAQKYKSCLVWSFKMNVGMVSTSDLIGKTSQYLSYAVSYHSDLALSQLIPTEVFIEGEYNLMAWPWAFYVNVHTYIELQAQLLWKLRIFFSSRFSTFSFLTTRIQSFEQLILEMNRNCFILLITRIFL